jgi:hypothetical protein
MSERGEYRSIRTVLIDGPDYQQLSPESRLVFLTLKLQLGPTGIGVLNAARYALADQTGYTADVVGRALSELERTGWLRFERNVYEVVGGLKHEPSIQPTNANHRKSVNSYVAGLPNLALVRSFVAENTQWFEHATPMPSATHANGMGDAIAITEDRQQTTEDRTLTTETPVSLSSFPSALITKLNQGMIDNPAIGEAMNPVPHGHGPSVAAALVIEASGVSREFASQFVYDAAKRFRPVDRNRQIKSLGYLSEATISAWEKSQALHSANGSSRPAARTNDKTVRSVAAIGEWLAEQETIDAEVVHGE